MKPALYPDCAPIRLKPSPYLPNAEFKRRQRVICSLLPDLCHLSEPDDLSPLAPPLPIPNRTVKRRRADDSTDCPCESRSSSGTLHHQAPLARPGLFAARKSAEIRISQPVTWEPPQYENDESSRRSTAKCSHARDCYHRAAPALTPIRWVNPKQASTI